jgi:hypothetical protein
VVNTTPQLLYPRDRNLVSILQEADWDPRPFWIGAKNLAHTGIRSVDRPARGESLYRLPYPGLHNVCITNIKHKVLCNFLEEEKYLSLNYRERQY